MTLLERKLTNGTYFTFDKILISGYKIHEDYDRTTQKFINGNRKQFLSSNEDVTITITLGTLDGNTTKTYIDNLISGEYRYWSLKYKTYKSANFIIEQLPDNTIESAADEVYVADFDVTLLKASDVSA